MEKKIYKCEKCEREFHRPQNLKMHERSCKGEKVQQQKPAEKPAKKSIPALTNEPIEQSKPKEEQIEQPGKEEKDEWDIYG